MAERIRSLRNHGREREHEADWRQHSEVGYNYRLSEISCTLGLGQLRRLPGMLQRRAEIARMYHEHLRGEPRLVLPSLEIPGASVSWFVYVVQLDDTFDAADRDRIVSEMERQGIGCGRYFAPIHLQPAYSAWRTASFPATESVASRTIALPFYNRISEPQIAEVCGALLAAMA
jgi:perosamine synthetase